MEVVPTKFSPASNTTKPPPKRFIRQQVPAHISGNEELKAAMAILPPNYNFEIPKTIWRIQQAGARSVALQFPEGLLLFACPIADILERFSGVDNCLILGDVTYGACCIEDQSAAAMGADFLVHYGHSCLVPVSETTLPCLYVFVDIVIDVPHLVATVKKNFESQTRLALAGTIQFATAVQQAKAELSGTFSSVGVPQSKPLSPGEVLGCTAPVLNKGSTDVIVFVSDGRFHLEAIMIANPAVPAYRYDPYARVLTKEEYDHVGMKEARKKAIQEAQKTLPALPELSAQGILESTPELESTFCCKEATSDSSLCCSKSNGSCLVGKGSSEPFLDGSFSETVQATCQWGIVLGTLGRQGNPKVLDHVRSRLKARGVPNTVFLISELSPSKIEFMRDSIQVWVQIACPRLSIDWGEAFVVPVLTPYEAEVALGFVPPFWDKEVGAYPMDYYSKDGGPWNSTYTAVAAKK